MAENLLFVAKGLFAVAGCFAGVRLAWMARQPSGDAMHARVSGMILVAGIGLVGFASGPALAGSSEALARGVMIASDGFERIALILLAWFVWHAFGRGDPLRAGLAVFIVATLALDWVQVLRSQQWPDPQMPVFVDALSQVAFSLGLVWSTTESLLEYRRSIRQRALGLTTPAVANRFALWSVATGCMALVCLTTAVSVLVTSSPGWSTTTALLRSALYSAAAGVIVLGFFPPRAYVRWVEGEAGSGATSGEPAAS